MATRYETQEMYGVTPLLLLFLARADKEIVRVRPFAFTDGGRKHYLDSAPRYRGDEKYGKGVEIEFTDRDHRTLRTLTYFSANIADGGLSVNKPTRDFLTTIDSGCVTYVKSATYLMHKAYFSTIRNTVLSKSCRTTPASSAPSSIPAVGTSVSTACTITPLRSSATTSSRIYTQPIVVALSVRCPSAEATTASPTSSWPDASDRGKRRTKKLNTEP